MTHINPVHALEEVVAMLSKKLSDYKNQANPNERYIQKQENLIYLLSRIQYSLETLNDYDVWLIVEREIQKIRLMDKEIGNFIIIYPLHNGKENAGYININTNQNAKN